MKKNVLFIYSSIDTPVSFSTGISLLSTILKKKGFGTKLLLLDDDFKKGKLRVKKALKNFEPLFVGISATTLQAKFALEVARVIKNCQKNTFVIVGGPHPTFYPEETIRSPHVDAICLGEGEKVVEKLALALYQKKPKMLNMIPNIWFKSKQGLVKNKTGEINDLNRLPDMDLDIWDFDRLVKKRNGWVDFIAGRGCPFSCSFCFNGSFRKSLRCPSEYIRFRDPQKIVKEIKKIINRYLGVKNISFVDDVFTVNKVWLREFLKLYAENLSIPFVINTTANLIDEEIVRFLKNAGCWMIRMGIETGNEKIRKSILNKPISNQEIKKAVEIIHKYKIKVLSYNMVGIPGEDVKNIMETLRFNAKLEVDVVRISTLLPFKGTDIYQYCFKRGLLRSPLIIPNSFDLGYSPIKFSKKHLAFIAIVQKYLYILLNFYLSSETKIAYSALFNKLTKKGGREIFSEEVFKGIEQEAKRINRRLRGAKIPHYERKFAPYFAVLS